MVGEGERKKRKTVEPTKLWIKIHTSDQPSFCRVALTVMQLPKTIRVLTYDSTSSVLFRCRLESELRSHCRARPDKNHTSG